MQFEELLHELLMDPEGILNTHSWRAKNWYRKLPPQFRGGIKADDDVATRGPPTSKYVHLLPRIVFLLAPCMHEHLLHDEAEPCAVTLEGVIARVSFPGTEVTVRTSIVGKPEDGRNTEESRKAGSARCAFPNLVGRGKTP